MDTLANFSKIGPREICSRGSFDGAENGKQNSTGLVELARGVYTGHIFL